MTVKRLWIICGPLIYLLFSTFNESIMPCEIKVLIELYGPIDTGVIIWITNIIGRLYLFLSSVFRSQVRSSSGLPHFFQEIFKLTLYLLSMYFIFARTFDLVRSFFFFFGNRSTTQNWPFPFLNTKWFKIGKKFVVEVVEITTELKSEMRSFKINENIHKKVGGSYYVVSANKASSVTL